MEMLLIKKYGCLLFLLINSGQKKKKKHYLFLCNKGFVICHRKECINHRKSKVGLKVS